MSTERERFDEEIAKKIKRESDNAFPHHHHQNIMGGGGRRHISAAAAGTLNTVTPCAACKLLRRRCAQECPFSPYFSPHEPLKFAAVHKVFGASNVSKMLLEVHESQRADAANSLVYEANVRLRDPVYGCMGAISALHHQIEFLHAELNAVRNEILKYKYNNTDQTNTLLHSSSSSSHITLLPSGAVSIAAPPPPTPPPLPPPPPSLPVRPLLSPSPMYTPVTSSSSGAAGGDFSTENITYFG
ncbi:hypothetical protein ABFX02_06G058100 [Erythranthe guttata]